MNRFLIIVLLLFATIEVSAQTAFKYKHEINVMNFGLGTSNKQAMLMDLEYPSGYSQRIGESRWRWGVSSGLLANPAERFWDGDIPTEYLGSLYLYLLGYVDYALTSKKHTAWFLRGGIAPSLQVDMWGTYNEKKASALAQLGTGLDVGRCFRVSLIGFTSMYGEVGYLISYSFSWRWGK